MAHKRMIDWLLGAGTGIALAAAALVLATGDDTAARMLLAVLAGWLLLVQVRRIADRRGLRAELAAAHKAAQAAVQTRTTFLASISHELRSPLSNILLLVTVLERQLYGELTDRQREAISNIGASGRHLLEMVNDLLDLAKIEAARLELNVQAAELGRLIDASFRLVYDQAAQKGLAVDEPQVAGDILVRVDELRFKQALVNLLANAIKYTPEGGRVGVFVDTQTDDGMVAVTIWDTGIGISPEDQQRVFEPFVQVGTGCGETESRGTGLGLALVKRIIEQHGGTISLASELGTGSRFTIRIPLVPQSRRRRPTSSSSSLPPVLTTV